MGLKEDYLRASQQDQWDSGPVDEVFIEKWPVIHEYLTEWQLAGKERLLSDLKLSKHPEGYAVTLNDHHFRRSLTAVADDIWQALDVLEHRINAPRPDWRNWGITLRKNKVAQNRWGEEGNSHGDS